MKSFRDMNPYMVGIVSILIIGAMTGAAFAVGLTHFLENTYPLRVEFKDAAGLRNGDSVRVAGVKVGRVEAIKADHQDGLVIVDLVVNHGTHLGTDTRADVALETLLGAKYVRLRSHPTVPYLEDLPKNDNRRTIPVERTTTPFDVFDLTRHATENIKELNTAELNKIITDFADITQGKQQSVADLVQGLDKVATAIASRDQELAELLDRADTVSQTLADKDQTLVALIDQSKQILDLLANRRDELARALGAGSDAVTELSSIIGDHEVQLDRILSTLHPALDVVAANQQNIDTMLAWLGPGLYNQALAGSHGPWADVFVRSLGPDVVSVMCHALVPQATTCPP